MSIPIYMVEGCGAGPNGLYNIALPIEATDEDEAIEKALVILQARKIWPAIGLKSHRCGEMERELDRWVRHALAKIFGR